MDLDEVHWFCDAEAWWVVAGGATHRFSERTEALEAAKVLARRTAPSRLTTLPPTGWRSPAGARTEHEAPDRVVEAPHGGAAAVGAVDDAPVDWVRLAGPQVLGRSILLAPGADVPAPWRGCDRVAVTTERLEDATFLQQVRHAFLSRSRLAYVLDERCAPPPAGSNEAEVWSVPVDHDFVAESTWTLVTWNAVDARSGAPMWEWATRARALGAGPGATADVRLVDGREAWCDGGPLRLWADGDLPRDTVVVPRESILVGRLDALSVRAAVADLAPDQLVAVEDPEMRARIIAPAGSGKTRVLSERARHLLSSAAPADALTLVAFNKRAQLEIVQRTGDLHGLHVRTLNALALSILNGSRGFAPRASTVTTIDEVQVRELLQTLVRFPRRANTDPAAPWLDALSRVRLGLRSPMAVEVEFGGDVEGFTNVYPRYRRELARRSTVDFDEQVHLCLEVLLREPEVRHHAERRCQVLLVDEFQDLTPAHMLLLRLLAGPTLSLFGVGDDDQTIYGYSGATPRWLVDFDGFVPDAAHHALSVNYRCPTPVVEAASNLLTRNRVRVKKTIRAGPDNVTAPGSLAVRADADPAATTTEIVLGLLADGARPDEIAVLTRVNSLLAPIQASLVGQGVPVAMREGLGFLARTGVAAALSWLELAATSERFAASDLARAARRPSRGLSPRVIEWISEQPDVRGIERLAARVSDARSSDKVAAFARDLTRIRELARTGDSASILEFTRSDVGLETSMQTLDEAHVGRNSQAHSDDLRALLSLGRLHPDATTFASWLRGVLSASSSPDGVTLATVHRVKGLEWPHVVVHDVTGGLFPHRLSTDVEEERRIFHVAITRAVASLHLVADDASPSFFLSELAAPDLGVSVASEVASVSTPTPGPTDVAAAVGLALRWGGYECRVLELAPHHATVAVASSRIQLPFGSIVEVDGRPRRLARPPAATRAPRAPSGDADPTVLDALKRWRRERSQRDKVPAFVVASDRTLEQLALAMPETEAALLDVHGIGAAKLERYGDEVLAVLDTLR